MGLRLLQAGSGPRGVRSAPGRVIPEREGRDAHEQVGGPGFCKATSFKSR